MMSDYYDEEALINVLKSHLQESDVDAVDWKAVIDDGEVYEGMINNVSNPFIYEVPSRELNITVFVHPQICSEVYWDAWDSKEDWLNGDVVW